MIRALICLLLSLAGSIAAGGSARAHDLANQVVVQAFIKEQPELLHMLVRVPLILLQGLGLPERDAGYLDREAGADALDRAALAVADRLLLVADGEALLPEAFVDRISLPSERAFESFDAALAHIRGAPLPAGTDVLWNQGFLDVELRYPAVPPDADLMIDVALGADFGELVQVVVRHVLDDGTVRAFRVHGGHGLLELTPDLLGAALTFARSGIEHILSGFDHLLFLLCLILPFRLASFGHLVGIVTAFTVAHSITLIASALGHAPQGDWFPPLVETLIAVSIVYMALENVWTAWGGHDATRRLRFRWLITGCFGLIHGFGFAFVLAQELQFAGEHLLASLLAFNVGVEIGQIAVLLVVLPVFELALRRPAARRLGVIILSALICHTAWHWMQERLEVLRLIPWPEPDWSLLRLPLAGLLIALGLALLVLSRRRAPAAAGGGD
jgi:hypothetical protein